VLVIEADPAALDEFRAAQNLETPKAASGAGAVGDGVDAGGGGGARRRAHRGQDGGGGGPRLAAEHDADGHRAAGQRITKSLRKTVIEPGDILLLLAPADRADDVVAWLGGMVLADRGLVGDAGDQDMGRHRRSSAAPWCWRRWG
jgi:hypothetical protein